MKLKHPTKIAGHLYPKDTEVRLATTSEIKGQWPHITENAESLFIAVMFPDRVVPTILFKNQLADFD